MLFQSLVGAALALAANANPIFNVNGQQPVLGDGDGLREEQGVDVIEEFVSRLQHSMDNRS
jgi:hypothetical protein